MRPVLLVDDARDERGMLAFVLREAGYRVVEADDGRQALDYLLAHDNTEPAVVIVDALMPVMDGWEFLAVMRSYLRLSRIPSIVVSGREPPHDATSRGADHFVTKPVDARSLLELVTKLTA